MTTLEETVTNGALTLGQRLADGPIALPEALRYAMTLAEALRQIHDSGRTCGAVLPSNIAVTATGLSLIDTSSSPATVTPYTAPEILQGHPADSRSDIFAFGAVLYEMVMGRPAFRGEDADALAVSLTSSSPEPSGTQALDHLVSNCIAKDPSVRCQRIQKVILELKLLTYVASRAEAATRQQTATAALRAETMQLEARVAELVQAHEVVISELQQASSDAIGELRQRLSNVESELAPAQARSAMLETLCQRLMAHVEQLQQNLEGIDERINGLGGGIDVLSQSAASMKEFVGARMHEFEHSLKSQRTEIASVVAGQAQTDDVVEGVVGAMELLHTMVIEHAEE